MSGQAFTWAPIRRHERDDNVVHGQDVETLVRTLIGRGAPLSSLRRERPQLLTRSIWAYKCVSGNLRRIIDSQASEDWFDGHGRGWSEDAAAVGAIAEALENYAVCLAGSGGAIQFGSAQELGAAAVRPERFPCMSPAERHEHQMGSPAADETSRIGWYEGHNLADGEPALLPAQLVLGGYPLQGLEARIQYASSKGLGAHWSDAAATLHGLCEVIEADAYMTTYLNRFQVREIDLSTISDASLETLLASVGGAGVEFLRAWDLTNDLGVATVLAALGGSLYAGPVVTFGCAAAPEPGIAVTKAIHEAIHTTAWLTESSVTEARRWTMHGIEHVRGRAGHKLLGANPEYVKHLDWLLATDGHMIAIDDLPRIAGSSVERQLDTIVAKLAAAGLTAYGCNLTPPDLAESIGMRVWRVIAPEAQPFGLFPTRYLDSPRLRELPVRLNYRDDQPKETDFNRVPHPCP